jgi:hypothetical protein
MQHLLLIAGALMIFALPVSAETHAASNPRSYIGLNDDFATLRHDFNNAKGSVRLLFVVDPICPGCLRGLDDMNRDLLAHTTDPRLQTFVVHVPVLGAREKDVMPAARLLNNFEVRHYWNASGAFGNALAEAVSLKNKKEPVYAWDVWLLYGPDAEWTGANPPQPQLLMHQLRKLEGTKFPTLNSKTFAATVQSMLSKLPPKTTVSK